MELGRRRDAGRGEVPGGVRGYTRTTWPIPPPPSKPRAAPSPKNEERPFDEQPRATSAEDKWAALRAYRQARGLCRTCGEKWARGHRCASSVSLHVVEELMAILTDEESGSGSTMEAEEIRSKCLKEGEDLMMISKEAMEGGAGPRTIRLKGVIQHQEVLMLVDSGSSHSFISEELAHRLQGVTPSLKAMKVKVSNGGQMWCTKEVPRCEWGVQRHKFVTDMKVLQLSCYDAILGMDWLEDNSPMHVHWMLKKLSFEKERKTISLVGIQPAFDQCKMVDSRQVKRWVQSNVVLTMVQLSTISHSQEDQDIPAGIQKIIQQYAELFDEPQGLPPHRTFDHSIPLMPGSRPVNLRPYRFNPAQKDEIEKQVAEMLRQGVIVVSHSPFSSPVLLVGKKDGTWRLCMDYRHLDAITIKNIFLLPIIDGLLDELAGAVWFTCLDMRAGYHQIRIKPGDEFKTAFKTHMGHYEFKVMAYGLTRGPATFQSTMNTILAPLLRKGVLVFIDDILIYSVTLEEHVRLLQQVFQILQTH